MPWQLVILRTMNMGESDIQQSIQHIVLPERVTLSFRRWVMGKPNKIVISSRSFLYKRWDELTQQYTQAIGEFSF